MTVPLSALLLIVWLPLACNANAKCSSTLDSQGKAWLESNRHLRAGRATALSVTFCQSKTLIVQVWQTLGEGDAKLVWQKELPPQSATGQPSVVNLNVDEYLDITTEHRLGLYLPDGETFPVSTLFTPTAPQLLSSEENGPFTTDDIYKFSDVANPYSFQIDFCNGLDCYPSQANTSTTAVTTSTPKLIECGSPDLETQRGKVLLESTRPLMEGRLRVISFSACRQFDFYVQLWILGNESNAYQLVWQKSISSRLLDNAGIEKIVVTLNVTEYVDITTEHRLGLYLPDGETFPVSTIFTPTAPQLLSSEENGPFTTDEIYKFSDLELPYKFDIYFCDTEDCYPSDSSTGPPAVVPTSPPDSVDCGSLDLDAQRGKVLLESTRPLVEGRLRAIRFSACRQVDFYVQIWILGKESNAYQLVWQKFISSRLLANAGIEKIVVNVDEYTEVTTEHRLGLYLPDGDTLPVSTLFTPKDPQLLSSLENGPFTTSEIYEFDDLGLPYKFDLEFCNTKDCKPRVDGTSRPTNPPSTVITTPNPPSTVPTAPNPPSTVPTAPNPPSTVIPTPNPPSTVPTAPNPSSTVPTAPNPPSTVPTAPPNSIDCRSKSLEIHRGKIMLEATRPLMEGRLRAIRLNVCRKADFYVQLWSRADDGNVYQLVWQKLISSLLLDDADGKQIIIPVDVSKDEHIEMHPSFRLGLHSPDKLNDPFPVPHMLGDFNGDNLVRSATTGSVSLCSQVEFDGSLYPQRFHLDLCNTTDCRLFYDTPQIGDSKGMCKPSKGTTTPPRDNSLGTKPNPVPARSSALQNHSRWHVLALGIFLLCSMEVQ